jgi:diguanylate cyclase (GGDEF)-like protein/PAS domain S-box-containing protein
MNVSFSQAHIEIYKSIIEYNPDAIVIVSTDGIIMEVNPALSKLLGYSKLEVQGLAYQDLIISNDLETVNQQINQVLNGVPSEVETSVYSKDGKKIYLQVKFIPLSVNKQIMGVCCIFRDVTERRKIERALNESEKKYRRLVENSPEPIVVYQNEFIKYANPACVKLFGSSSIQEVIGQSIKDYFDSDSIHLIEQRINQAEEIGTIQGVTEEKVVLADGTVIDVEVTGITIKHEGKPAFLMMYHDITSRKCNEQALRKSEERYRLIAENMTDLVCLIAWDGSFKYASPSHVTVLGYPSEDYEGKYARDCMHKDDHPNVRKKLEKTIKTKEASSFEFRFRDIEENWIWLEGKATSIFNVKGDFEHFLVVSRDITERRILEEKLSHMAHHDTLTGLPNRRVLFEQLKQSLKESDRYQRRIALMFLDLDRFKHINDTYGHDAGDELLKQFTNRVQGCIRESDVLVRLGGDVFVVLLPEISCETQITTLAERIISSLQKPWKIFEHEFVTTSSIGIAFYEEGDKEKELLKKADIALYQAKSDGKNNYCVYHKIGQEKN